MNLVLWRHAEAEDGYAGGDDLTRRLTAKGRRQAARMSQWLNHHLPADTQVIASPAVRTRQTVQALGRAFTLDERLLPTVHAESVLELLQWDSATGLPGDGTILLVGHQPWLGEVVARLLHIEGGQCAVRKAAIWWLVTRMRDGHHQTVLRSVADPEFILPSADDRS